MEDNTIRRNHIYYSSNIFAILIECYQTMNDQTMFNLNHFPFTIRTLAPMNFIDSDVGADRLIRRFVFRTQLNNGGTAGFNKKSLKTRIQLKNPKLCIFKKPSTAGGRFQEDLSDYRPCRTIDLPPIGQMTPEAVR